MARYFRYCGGQFEAAERPVVEERPLAVYVNGVEVATLLCTPTKVECLVVGFLSFEGVVPGPDAIQALDAAPEAGVVDVRVRGAFQPPRRKIFTSGCTGGITFSLNGGGAPLAGNHHLDPERVVPLMKELYARATGYQLSRGIHAAALADVEGGVLLVAEDVGRHNALDKILGEALLTGVETEGRILLSSGRISTEMLRKGAFMRTPFIISRTSPTAASVELGKRLGITLIGYVRGDGFNIYSHPERLAPTPATEMPASRVADTASHAAPVRSPT
jgi:FdhD protein